MGKVEEKMWFCRDGGKKLISWHGWADSIIMPEVRSRERDVPFDLHFDSYDSSQENERGLTNTDSRLECGVHE